MGDGYRNGNGYYEKWLWVELIGFDNTASDYGVQAYLDNVGFLPEGVSLLLFTPDFIHAHPGMAAEHTLPPEVCSYGARPFGKERNLQSWTNYELRGLIAELRRHGTEVYCSFFDLFHVKDKDNLRATEWCARHPELYEMRKTGEPFRVINPLKRLADGSYYEDLFVRDLTAVLSDYGFDGYHGADGYTSPRLCLADIDYSDDMADQFRSWCGGEIGAGYAFPDRCDGDAAAMLERGEWIWRHKRLEWIRFHAARWSGLWRKIMQAVRAEGKKAVLNTAWTRDPFEALYRYGVDYRMLAECGIDGFVVEAGAAALSIGADEIEYEPCTEFMATILSIKAYVPQLKLICLNAIHDTYEQWDVLNHAPSMLERDVYSFSNLYLQDRSGLRRCTGGFVACLADAVSRTGWENIARMWRTGYEGRPERLVGASFVWSDDVLHRSLERYVGTREWPVHKYVHELLERGAPLHGVVNVHDLDQAAGAIVVTNLHLLSERERELVAAYRGGPVLVIGIWTEELARAAAGIGLPAGGMPNRPFYVWRGEDGEWGAVTEGGSPEQPPLSDWDATGANDSLSWLYSLYYRPVPEAFLQSCVASLIERTGALVPMRNEEHIRTVVLEMSPDKWRVIIRNLHMNYKAAKLDTRRRIDRIDIRSDFPGVPVIPQGSTFSLYTPGRGMVIADLHF